MCGAGVSSNTWVRTCVPTSINKNKKNDNYHTGFNKTALYVWGRSVVKYLSGLALSEAKVKVIVQVFGV